MRGAANPQVQIRPFAERSDYEGMIDYFLNASDSFLKGMGVDPGKLPDREAWLESVLLDHERDMGEKERFYLAWIYEGIVVGHSSINQIKVGEEAFIHLHLWDKALRKTGLGTKFFAASVAEFLRVFRLKRLYSEPFSGNPAPSRVLENSNFRFIKKYRTTPGPINFEQNVNKYVLESTSLEE